MDFNRKGFYGDGMSFHGSSSDRSRSHPGPSHQGQSQAQGQNSVAPIVAKHYNELQEKGLAAREQSRILYMRNFNNWIKSMLIGDAVDPFRNRGQRDLVLLDLGCGKGGDIFKWLKTNMIGHVVFADIAKVSVEQCEERYRQIPDPNQNQGYRNPRNQGRHFTAQFITADCTSERLRDKYQDPKIQFDIVSCQFSFHYCFESSKQAQLMMQNISENLKPGGIFIGTIPYANRIVKKLREAEHNEFGNRIYKIRFETQEPFPIFGAKYFFQLDDVVNCPEFLVHFPVLEKLAEMHGLKLKFKYSFDEYFHEKLKVEGDGGRSHGHFLLQRMRAMETFPPVEPKSVREVDAEYLDAKNYFESTPNCKPIGTLSKSEWETATLYLVFAFEKVR